MNTADLLGAMSEALRGDGHEVRELRLYDLDFKGCRGCFSCKRSGSRFYGCCAMKDGLTEPLSWLPEVEAILLASPIYFGSVTGEMRSFLERLLYPSLVYSSPTRSNFGRNLPVGMVYTMNVSEATFRSHPMKAHLEATEGSIARIFGRPPKSFFAFETNQLKDYSGVEYTYADPEARLRRHQEVWPSELSRARAFARELLAA